MSSDSIDLSQRHQQDWLHCGRDAGYWLCYPGTVDDVYDPILACLYRPILACLYRPTARVFVRGYSLLSWQNGRHFMIIHFSREISGHC